MKKKGAPKLLLNFLTMGFMTKLYHHFNSRPFFLKINQNLVMTKNLLRTRKLISQEKKEIKADNKLVDEKSLIEEELPSSSHQSAHVSPVLKLTPPRLHLLSEEHLASQNFSLFLERKKLPNNYTLNYFNRLADYSSQQLKFSKSNHTINTKHYIPHRFFSQDNQPLSPLRKPKQYIPLEWQHWLKEAAFTVTGGIIGYAWGVATPPSFIEEKNKKWRSWLGTDILEIEDLHVIPSQQDKSHLIERKGMLVKLDHLFKAMEAEKAYSVAESVWSSVFSSPYQYRKHQRGVYILMITGVSGSGKSELIEEYVTHDAKKMENIMPSLLRTEKLFTVTSIDDFKQQYRQFAMELNIPVQNFKKEEDLIIEVNAKLALRPHWLMVFDNINSKEEYEIIKNFIPEGGKYQGRVILAGQTREVISDSDQLNMKIIDLSSTEYRFTPDEAICLIDATLGNAHPLYGQRQEYKIELADQLGYLPQALKKAALYIKYSHGENALPQYIQWLKEQLKQQGVASSQEIEVPKHHHLLNELVNTKSIEAMSKNNLALSILSFVIFLNPDFIQRAFLQLKYANEEKGAFAEALELLKKYGLLEDKGHGYFKLHRTLIDSTRKIVPILYQRQKDAQAGETQPLDEKILQEKFAEQQLNEVIAFTRKYFKRDNTTIRAKQVNSLFETHINTLLKFYLESQGANLVNFVSLKVALATYYMVSGRSLKSIDILEANKQLIEERYRLDNLLNKPFDYLVQHQLNITYKTLLEQAKAQPQLATLLDEVQTKLLEVPTEVLTVYAPVLYHLGCTFYDIGDLKNKKYYNQCLEQALLIRRAIKLKTKDNAIEAEKDKAYNEYGVDTLIMKRNGLWKFKYKETSSISELEKIATIYEKMIQRELDKKNKGEKYEAPHIQSCRSEQFRVYQKLAKLAENPLKQTYCEKAACAMYGADYSKAFDSTSSETKINYEMIFNQICENPRLKEDTRKARYLNDLANLLVLQGKSDHYQIASRCYKEAIKLIEEKVNVSVDLPSAYLGLAHLYLLQANYPLAEKAIKRCQMLQKELAMHQDHEEVKEAAKIAKQLIHSAPVLPDRTVDLMSYRY